MTVASRGGDTGVAVAVDALPRGASGSRTSRLVFDFDPVGDRLWEVAARPAVLFLSITDWTLSEAGLLGVGGAAGGIPCLVVATVAFEEGKRQTGWRL
jgi:hypothetical protein